MHSSFISCLLWLWLHCFSNDPWLIILSLCTFTEWTAFTLSFFAMDFVTAEYAHFVANNIYLHLYKLFSLKCFVVLAITGKKTMSTKSFALSFMNFIFDSKSLWTISWAGRLSIRIYRTRLLNLALQILQRIVHGSSRYVEDSLHFFNLMSSTFKAVITQNISW